MTLASPLFALAVALQAPVPAPAHPAQAAGPARAAAARAATPPVLDGRDTDAVWGLAEPITAFTQFEPLEEGPARFPTMAKAAYDDHNFYAFIRAFDPHPDSIRTALTRRDVRGPSDQLKIMIDSYHDRRSGYEFAVNPVGVKRDYIMYDDRIEDESWDAVWDVATRIDSLGWTAEFRIPLSQLRFADKAEHTFGFAVWRDIERYKERVSWPTYRGSRAGISSQIGELTGIRGIVSTRRLELMPYVVAKNVSRLEDAGYDRAQEVSAGADIKWGLTSNLTVDATVNPDFGQVESDPAVFNLSEVETLFAEKRPFFIEGTGIFRFDVGCNEVTCQGEGLFYSRRIGRAPQVGDGDARSPIATTILGAAKLTGRTARGLSIGFLDAVTQRERGGTGVVVEPRANYSVVRLQQELRDGETSFGVVATGVSRNLQEPAASLLRRSAIAGGVDVRHRFLARTYEVSGLLSASRISGTPAAIAVAQRCDPFRCVHNYARPDENRYDPTRTSLTGDNEEVSFAKVSGNRTRFEVSYQRISRGYDINDVGYLARDDRQEWSNWFGLLFLRPTPLYLRAFLNLNWWQHWTTSGLPIERSANVNGRMQLHNLWWLQGNVTAGQLSGTIGDRYSRGGPAVRRSPFVVARGLILGDERRRVVPELFGLLGRGDYGRSRFSTINPAVRWQVSMPLDASIGVSYSRNLDDSQWYDNFYGATDTAYTFARLKQRTLSVTTRVNYTMTPDLSLQVYAEPFVTKGDYSDVRELSATPRARDYDDRFVPYPVAEPGGFNFKQFRSNTVLRWEYRPGSSLFAVWAQGRQGFAPAFGDDSFGSDYRDLLALRPDNTFLVKASYWFGR